MSELNPDSAFDPVRARPRGDDEPPPAVAPGALRGEGMSADGSVQATVTFEGRIDQLILDPRVFRPGPDDTPESLAQHVMEAVNAAVDRLHEAIRDDTGGMLGGVEGDLDRAAQRFDATLTELYADIARTRRRLES